MISPPLNDPSSAHLKTGAAGAGGGGAKPPTTTQIKNDTDQKMRRWCFWASMMGLTIYILILCFDSDSKAAETYPRIIFPFFTMMLGFSFKH